MSVYFLSNIIDGDGWMVVWVSGRANEYKTSLCLG